jgi:hypothetical protein
MSGSCGTTVAVKESYGERVIKTGPFYNFPVPI